MIDITRHFVQISAEEVQKLLKDLLFSLWNDPVCGPAVGLVKLLSLIDFYLPFFPLERWHVDRLFRMKLENRQREEMDVSGHQLQWDDAVIDFLTSKACCLSFVLKFCKYKLSDGMRTCFISYVR